MCRHGWNEYTSLWKSLRSWNAVSIVLYTIGTRQKRIRFPWKLFQGISCCFEQIREKSYHEDWKHFRDKITGTTKRAYVQASLDYRKVANVVEICDEILFFSAAKKISSRSDTSLYVFSFFLSFFFFFSATTCVMRLQSGHSWHLEAFSSRQAHLRCCNCVKHYAGKRKPLEMQIFAAGVIKALVEWKWRARSAAGSAPVVEKNISFRTKDCSSPFLRQFSAILSSVWRDKFNRIPKNPFILEASKNMLKFIEVLRAPFGTNFPSWKRSIRKIIFLMSVKFSW